MPKNNDYKIGYQFPFNSTEILCSTSQTFQEKLLYEEKNENMNFSKNEFEDNINKSTEKDEENSDKKNKNEIRFIIIDYIFIHQHVSKGDENGNIYIIEKEVKESENNENIK